MVHLLVVHPLDGLSLEAYDCRILHDSTFIDSMDRCSIQVEGLYSSDHSILEEDPLDHHLFFFIHLSCEEVYGSFRNHLYLFIVLGYNDQSHQVVDPYALVYHYLHLFSFFGISFDFHHQ